MGTIHAKDGASSVEELDLTKIPATVKRIHIKGLQRTKTDVLAKRLQDVYKADNFADLVRRLQIGKLQLQRLGLFQNVKIQIDTSADGSDTGYDVTYSCREHSRFTGGINFMVGTNEGNGVLQLKLPNTLGRGESVSLDISRGTRQPLGGGLAFRRPLRADPDISFGVGVSQLEFPQPQSSFTDLRRVLSLDLKFPTFLGAHVIRWDGAWRHLSCLNENAPFVVREEAGHSLKSSLIFTVERDFRDDKILPNDGHMAKYDLEIAGLGGDVNFHKHNLEFQCAKSFLLGTVLQASLALGHMGVLCPHRRLPIQDRFFLGGPLTLRGFAIDGAGPHEAGAALGADSYGLAGLHLYTPLPFRPGRGGFGDLFRLHGFVSGGTLLNSRDLPTGLSQAVATLRAQTRASLGAGLVMKMGGLARMELNYCMPLNAQAGDRINPGVQFGIGLSFL